MGSGRSEEHQVGEEVTAEWGRLVGDGERVRG